MLRGEEEKSESTVNMGMKEDARESVGPSGHSERPAGWGGS